jgi:3-dehydroquinate dehydratase-1
MREAATINTLPADLVEWRVDFFDGVSSESQVLDTLRAIKGILKDLPMIFTFRTQSEGGVRPFSPAAYESLLRTVIETGEIEAVDIELFTGTVSKAGLVALARKKEVKVVMSSHDFHKTPPMDDIVGRLLRAREEGADIPKIAVMPGNARDVGILLGATRIVKEDHGVGPLITMAMGGLGLVTRLSGEIFGSSLTFGAAGEVSAPGQIDVVTLKKIIALIHDSTQA